MVWASSNQFLLIAILTIQAILSLRLVWSNTAFLDETTYLLAGHVEIAHWLHGTPVRPYATYFSGAPVIYPPIGAIADSIGGLAGARILSLIFMLGTTSLLWSLTSKLFGRRAAVCAAALFAILGPTLRLGAFATYDAMALFLLAASAWCMVWSQDRDDSALRLLAGTVLLTLANATKYSTMLFDPSVVALAGLAVAGKRGPKAAVARSGYVAAGVFGLISVLLAIGGPWYLTGALSTTVSRVPGGSSALPILTDSWKWVGLVCVIAAVGVIRCLVRRHDRVQVLILTVLATSGVLVPLNQARIHTTTSLSKHVDFGAWFAAAAAGYAISRLSQVGRWKFLHLAVTAFVLTVIAIPVGITGRTQASEMFHEWPNSARMTARLRSLTQHYPGNYLAEDDDVPAYYLQSTVSWKRWSSTEYFTYTPPGASDTLTGLAAYRAAINRHYFSLIIIDFFDTTRTDHEIVADMQQSGSYRVVALVPTSDGQYMIWAFEPPQESASRDGHR
jgi:4-amino-4-deoxy-L-arabinose transferase-like glycosyltransferase